MKILKPWKLQLRKWQSEAFEKVKEIYDNGRNDFLCVATPGAGKTIFALRVAHHYLMEKKVERIVIICPTEHLKRQWAESAFKAGFDIDPNFENAKRRETSDYFGVSLTYAQVGRAPVTHLRNCEAKRTLVIFDEIHHLGDDLSWGDAVRRAFEPTVYRLAISGTPFRRDNNPIPFVQYKKSQSVADYTYGYSNAIADNVCRPVYFSAFEGEMEWRVKNTLYKSTFSEILDKNRASERLRTALDPAGKWLPAVIADADKKLNEIRSLHPNAGGLLISMDQAHAKNAVKMLEEITGEKPTIVVSDDPKASKKIKKFDKGSDRWLVAVKMVSEGVDIPRLRVGVYATNIKSELFFRQAVGRFVRNQADLKEQAAYIYIPKDIELVEYAKEIEVERDHYINKIDYVEDIFDRDPDLLPQKEEEKDDDKFEAIDSVATDKIQYELDFGKEFKPPEKTKKFIVKEKKNYGEPVVFEHEEIPVYEQIERIKKDIKNLSRLVAIRRGKVEGRIDWDFAHREWIKKGGKAIDQETRPELEKRLKWLNSQL